MGREINMEKEFSENIDRMLAGEEVQVSAAVSDDYRAAVDFAQRLIRLRPMPSAFFEAKLRERLLQRLSEQDMKTPARAKESWLQEGLKRLVPRQLVWRAVTATLLVAIVASGVFWQMGGFTQLVPPPPRPLSPLPKQPVRMEITSVKTTYLTGEEVEFISSETVVVIPSPSPMATTPPVIDHWEETVWHSPAGYERLKLGLAESVEYTITWTTGGD